LLPERPRAPERPRRDGPAPAAGSPTPGRCGAARAATRMPTSSWVRAGGPLPACTPACTLTFPTGEHRDTDRCCRDHDHCQHVIHPFTARYGYRNLRWHTISHCDCDLRPHCWCGRAWAGTQRRPCHPRSLLPAGRGGGRRETERRG
uniref:Phospholipase A2-like central domain-containing protein n=1 Tax=Otus sunia TaxID=257818 RepID=A0A8C8E974_9STRI